MVGDYATGLRGRRKKNVTTEETTVHLYNMQQHNHIKTIFIPLQSSIQLRTLGAQEVYRHQGQGISLTLDLLTGQTRRGCWRGSNVRPELRPDEHGQRARWSEKTVALVAPESSDQQHPRVLWLLNHLDLVASTYFPEDDLWVASKMESKVKFMPIYIALHHATLQSHF